MSSTRNPTVLYGVQVLQTKLCQTHIRQLFNTLHMQSQTTFWEASLSRLIKVRQTWNRFGLVPVQQGAKQKFSFVIGASIRIGQESQCLLYGGFFYKVM